ncbi:MAG TPA: hypothetical protein VE177_03320 [Candidatus Binatus sp.]|nr:hypothetical protein [Candidatus Binatus sp.]
MTAPPTADAATPPQVPVAPVPPPEPYDAYLAKGRAYLPDAGRVMELRERAFGTLTGNRVSLNPYEAFYLTEKKKIQVRNERTKKTLSLRELVTRLSVGKPAIWIKYLVYRDLRDRGYLVREKERFDFETFGKGATRRLVYIVYEGGETSLESLANMSAKANGEGKDLVLAVIDRRTDIVYYTLNTVEDFKEQVNQ